MTNNAYVVVDWASVTNEEIVMCVFTDFDKLINYLDEYGYDYDIDKRFYGGIYSINVEVVDLNPSK